MNNQQLASQVKLIARLPRRSMVKLRMQEGYLCGCSLYKATPIKTNVGKYVEANQKKLAGTIAAVLEAHGVAVAEKAAKAYAAKLAVLSAQKIRLVSNNKLQKADAVQSIIAKILDALGLEDVSVEIIESLSPELLKAFRKAGILGIAQVGISATGNMTNHLDLAALKYADAHSAELVKGLTETTTTALRNTLSEAVKNGWSTARLSRQIQEGGAFSKARANTIARTELAIAHTQGNVQGWRETGLVEKKEWIMGDLHDIEDECDRNAALGAIDMDAEFEGGVMFPPAHPNCICDVLPVLKEK